MLFEKYKNALAQCKNLYGRYWKSKSGDLEYYLKLDGYYYCSKQKCIMIIIRVRNKRIIDKMRVKDAVKDKRLVRELHPADACVIGFLANKDINGLANENCYGVKNIQRLREYRCFIKSEPLLSVVRRYFDSEDNEITILKSKHFAKEIEISTIELSQNEALLYALDCYEAIAVGYDVSELHLRRCA